MKEEVVMEGRGMGNEEVGMEGRQMREKVGERGIGKQGWKVGEWERGNAGMEGGERGVGRRGGRACCSPNALPPKASCRSGRGCSGTSFGNKRKPQIIYHSKQ